MDKFQRKIIKMREEIDIMRSDIQTVQSQREITLNSNNPLTKSKFNYYQPISPRDNLFEAQPKSIFNQFKAHLPMKKQAIPLKSNHKPCMISQTERKNHLNDLPHDLKGPVISIKSVDKVSDEPKQSTRRQRNSNRDTNESLLRALTDYKSNELNKILSADSNELALYIATCPSKENQSTRRAVSHKCNGSRSNSKAKGRDYEEMMNEILHVANRYSSKPKRISYEHFIENYKREKKQMRMQSLFIEKMLKLHQAKTGIDISYEEDSLLLLWKWIKRETHFISSQRNGFISDSDDNHNGSQCEYQDLCEKIMEEYQLRDIKELSQFIQKLLKKVNSNDCFIEGIKKILKPKKKLGNHSQS